MRFLKEHEPVLILFGVSIVSVGVVGLVLMVLAPSIAAVVGLLVIVIGIFLPLIVLMTLAGWLPNPWKK